MTTYEQKLELAKAETVITEDEYEATGGVYFDEDMGLWIRQDSDGGGIIPLAHQLDHCRSHGFDTQDVIRLFIDLDRS